MTYSALLTSALTILADSVVTAIVGAGGVVMVAGGLFRAFKRLIR